MLVTDIWTLKHVGDVFFPLLPLSQFFAKFAMLSTLVKQNPFDSNFFFLSQA